MMSSSEHSTHSHQFTPVWQSDCTLISWCSCGETRECTIQELQEFLSNCIGTRVEYLQQRDLSSSKSKQQEFARAIAVKDRQIAWLENQIEERSHTCETTSAPITPIRIDPEFKALIPPLSLEERTQLEANLLAEGCRDPLVVWKGHNILLDGHNRYEICTTHGIEFNTIEIDLPERDAVHNWLINNQLGRRNLTPEAVSYLRGKRYNREKRQGERTDLTCGQNDHKLKTGEQSTCGQNDHKLKTADQIAANFKVNSRTIRRDAQFAALLNT